MTQDYCLISVAIYCYLHDDRLPRAELLDEEQAQPWGVQSFLMGTLSVHFFPDLLLPPSPSLLFPFTPSHSF